MTRLNQPLHLKSLAVSNRIVRSATWEGLAAKDGAPTAALAAFLGRLVAGGAGLVITGFAFVHPSGRVAPQMLGVESEQRVGDLRRLAEALHHTGGKIAVQLSHGGAEAKPTLTRGCPLMAPSVLEGMKYRRLVVEMTPGDVAGMVAAFAAAAHRVRTSGFDAVQIQASHGYLLSQFLSPRTNRRTDAYGGSIRNRSRFLFEVFEAVRGRVGNDFPVMVKVNASDFVDGGLEFKDALWVMTELARLGADAVEVSGGVAASGDKGPMRTNIRAGVHEAYLAPFAKKVREVVAGVPVITVGGIRSYEVAAKLLESAADMVALSRPLICEPDLPNRWLNGEAIDSACISCNRCFLSGFKKGGVACLKGLHSEEDPWALSK